MPNPLPQGPPRRSTAFLLIFALANAGGVIAYLPLLTLLLPIKVEAIAGEARLGVLTATVIAGAIAASVSYILFGALSDRSAARGGGRRGWLAGGVVATGLSFVAIGLAASPTAIILAMVTFQLAVNAALAPLAALMAEEIPDSQKGTAGGLIALANPLALSVSALLVGMRMIEEPARLGIVWFALAGCTVPLLLTRARIAVDQKGSLEKPHLLRRDLLFAWGARLLVQVAGTVLFLYLLYYFESVSPVGRPGALAPRVGQLLTIAFIIPLPVALLCGRLSDSTGRRKPFLLGAAMVATTGLLGMAAAPGWSAAAAAFCIYALGSATFLALHSAFAMQLLPDPAHRGRDLGFLNLANTLPALLGPLLAWLLATPRDFDALMLVLALLTLAGGTAILGVRGRH